MLSGTAGGSRSRQLRTVDGQWAAIELRSTRVARKLDRITINPEIMNGQPCIRGMRLTVRRVVEIAALYPDRSDLRREYPELEDEDVAEALDIAARS